MRTVLPQQLTPHAPLWVKKWTINMTQKEKIALGILATIFLISATISLIGFIDRHTSLIPQFGDTYREAAVGQPRYINPVLAGANDIDLDLSRLIYSSLFRLNNKFELENDLADSYEISADQTQYTIHLRRDANWHDGKQFTADDVVFTVRSIQTPDYGSPLLSSFQGVQVEKVDDFTVKFILRQPYAPFLTNLTVGVVPAHVWENIPPKNASLAEQMLKPVGTGPFKFAEITTRRKTGEITTFRMIRNEGFYGQRPYLDEFSVYFYQTNEEAVQALTSGKADGVGFLPLSLSEDVKKKNSLITERLLLPQYFSLFFNQIKSEPLSDAGVRSALSLATDREGIIRDALNDEAKPLAIPIPTGFFDFGNETPAATFDPEKAKQNLDEAGWKDENGDGVREKAGKPLNLKITTTDWPEYVKTAELIKQGWEAIGASVTVEQYGPGTIQQTIVGPREYEILLYGEILPAQPDPYPFWHSTQTRSPGLNLALFKDPATDKLLEEARKTSDYNERKEKYKDFTARILDLNPAIILYQPYYLFAHTEDVRGMGVENVHLPASRYNDVENWHIKTKRVWGK